jgi:hypothetical protein
MPLFGCKFGVCYLNSGIINRQTTLNMGVESGKTVEWRVLLKAVAI